jgi:hypothetical protein
MFTGTDGMLLREAPLRRNAQSKPSLPCLGDEFREAADKPFDYRMVTCRMWNICVYDGLKKTPEESTLCLVGFMTDRKHCVWLINAVKPFLDRSDWCSA